jgi:hypothetical protein
LGWFSVTKTEGGKPGFAGLPSGVDPWWFL